MIIYAWFSLIAQCFVKEDKLTTLNVHKTGRVSFSCKLFIGAKAPVCCSLGIFFVRFFTRCYNIYQLLRIFKAISPDELRLSARCISPVSWRNKQSAFAVSSNKIELNRITNLDRLPIFSFQVIEHHHDDARLKGTSAIQWVPPLLFYDVWS